MYSMQRLKEPLAQAVARVRDWVVSLRASWAARAQSNDALPVSAKTEPSSLK
jgi:hypothetical protein